MLAKSGKEIRMHRYEKFRRMGAISSIAGQQAAAGAQKRVVG